MSVRQAHLLSHVVISQTLVEFQKASGLKCLVMLIEGLFAGLEEIRSIRRKAEVEFLRYLRLGE